MARQPSGYQRLVLEWQEKVWFPEILKYLEIPYSGFWGISANPNLTWGCIQQLLSMDRISTENGCSIYHTPEAWLNYSNLPNITQRITKCNPEYPWSTIVLPKLLATPDTTYPGDYFSLDPMYPTLEEVLADSIYPWDWSDISRCSNISVSEMLQHPNIPWDWWAASENKTLRLSDLQKYPRLPWQWKAIANHPMTYSCIEYVQTRRARHIAGIQLQRHWRRCSNNPSYHLGNRLVLARAGYLDV